MVTWYAIPGFTEAKNGNLGASGLVLGLGLVLKRPRLAAVQAHRIEVIIGA